MMANDNDLIHQFPSDGIWQAVWLYFRFTLSSTRKSALSISGSGGKQAAPISPIALEAVKRIDALFDIEREINGPERRRVPASAA